MYNARKNFKSDKEWVADCDAEFDRMLNGTADEICVAITQRNLKFILISGPTCSGKTTATEKISERLKSKGINTETISIDDFFYSREELAEMSRERGVELDGESADGIDLKLLEQVFASLDGDTEIPIFDFKLGRRNGFRRLEYAPNRVFIVEGIQAMLPEVLEIIGNYGYASLFICPQTSLRNSGDYEIIPNELRLVRRIVRDSIFRNTNAAETLGSWRSIRKSESKHVFPYEQTADFRIDSTLPYEIGILKPYIEKNLAEVPSDNQYYAAACGISEFFKYEKEIPSEYLTSNSIYKEFIK